MTDKKSNDSRRKLLKSIAAGSGAVVAGKSLPKLWTKPVINSVMLPAHAETTTTGCTVVDVSGTWIFSLPWEEQTIIFYTDGTGKTGSSSDGPFTWVLSDNTVTFKFAEESNGEQVGILLALTDACNTAKGLATIAGGPDDGATLSFDATKQ